MNSIVIRLTLMSLALAWVLSCTVDRRVSCQAQTTTERQSASCELREEKELSEPPIAPEALIEI